MNWEAKGGKSNSQFRKTLDNRFVLKEMSKQEVQSFIEFAPQYVQYITDSIQNKVNNKCFQKAFSTINYLFGFVLFWKESDVVGQNLRRLPHLFNEKHFDRLKGRENGRDSAWKFVLWKKSFPSVWSEGLRTKSHDKHKSADQQTARKGRGPARRELSQMYYWIYTFYFFYTPI